MPNKPLFTAESLRELIDAGEGQFLELKGTWSYEREPPTPVAKDALRAVVARYVAAFANADGGTLVIGVEDDGEATGHTRTANEIEQLLAIPQHRLRSPVSFDHQLLELDGNEVLIIEVGRAVRAVMVNGDGFPYRTGDQVIAESEERINALKQEYLDHGFEQRLANARPDDIDLALLPAAAADPAWLARRGLVTPRHGTPAVSNAAVLLAGREPSVRWHERSSVRVFRVDGIERETGSRFNVSELARLDGPIVQLIPAAYEVLQGQIKRSEKLHDLFFREFPEYPTFAWQEAIVNAVAHRDYSDRGRGVEVWLYTDRMEILSPGVPVAPVTIEELQGATGTHVSRNPLIVRVLVDLGLMREQGEGVPRMFNEMQRSFLHEPEFSIKHGQLSVVLRNTLIFDSADPAWSHLVERLALSEPQRRALLAHPEGLTNEQYREVNGVDRDEAYRQIQEMVAAGVLLAAERSGPGAVYRLDPALMDTRAWLQQRLGDIRNHFALQPALTNADYRRLFEVTRYVARGELRRLLEEGVVELRGSGRGAHYVPGVGLSAGEK